MDKLIKKDDYDLLKKTNNVDNDHDIINICDLKSKEILHYNMLDNFFTNCHENQIITMISIINGNHLISLRFLDWFVTRYCNLYKLTILIDNLYNKEKNFNINISYKAQLKSFKKKYFDPFRRKKKIIYTYEKNNELFFLTTIGQLNFFRWAIINDIIKYTEKNYTLIMKKYTYVNKFYIKNNSDSNNNSSSNNTSNNTSNNKNNYSDNNDQTNEVIQINEINLNEKIFIKSSCPQITRNIYLEF